jgi:hypothetical protein
LKRRCIRSLFWRPDVSVLVRKGFLSDVRRHPARRLRYNATGLAARPSCPILNARLCPISSVTAPPLCGHIHDLAIVSKQRACKACEGAPVGRDEPDDECMELGHELILGPAFCRSASYPRRPTDKRLPARTPRDARRVVSNTRNNDPQHT